MKIQYIGAHPIAVMGIGYCGVVDHGDVIEVDEIFYNEVALTSKKWKKVEVQKIEKDTTKEKK